MVTEVVTAEEEVISHTVLAEGAFYPSCPTRFIGLIIYIAGDALVDFKLQPTKVLSSTRRNATALYICHTMYPPSHTAIHY